MLSILYRLNDNRSLYYHDMHEEPSALLAAAILFIGILIAVPISALAQQQAPQYDLRMEKDNKALVRPFVEEEVFNDHIIEVRWLSTMHNILYKTIHK